MRSTTDSRQVSRLVAEAEPDLVLLDLSMPFIDGYAILEQLRKSQPEGSYLPVVILTADVTSQARRRALTAGANDFLTKPFDNDEVLLRCKNLLAARTLHQALQNQNTALEETVRQRTKDLEETLAELRASQQQRVQQERLRAFGEMSSGVAQDFNNQLTVLIGYSDLLLLNNGQMVGNRPMAVRYLQTLRTAAQESAKIVGRLKEFSRRREADDIFLPINLPKLVRETAELTQPKWRNQGPRRRSPDRGTAGTRTGSRCTWQRRRIARDRDPPDFQRGGRDARGRYDHTAHRYRVRRDDSTGSHRYGYRHDRRGASPLSRTVFHDERPRAGHRHGFVRGVRYRPAARRQARNPYPSR